MDEIKFRAWLKNHKKMAEVLEIDFEGEQIIYSYFDSYGAFGVELKHVELLQFTGLYDKNKTPEHPQGVPIYEGHIIKRHNGEIGVVKFEEGIFDLDRTANINSMDKLRQLEYITWPNELFENCEVIGNIYENPELLEG